MQGEALDRSSNEMVSDPRVIDSDDNLRKEEFIDENACTQQSTAKKLWKPIEKGLLEKGLEIFGPNRSAYVYSFRLI